LIGGVVPRLRALLTILALLCAALIGGATPARADSETATAFQIPEDLHDGSLTQIDGLYVAVGTEYSCGFQWTVDNTPWCGFGYSTATSLSGPWSTPQLLFSPTSTDPWTGQSWQTECGGTGAGCFNPRLVQRSGWGANDGVLILMFNSPEDYFRAKSNAYNVMGCDMSGTTIGCGPGETVGPHGSYAKPSLDYCGGDGDFGLYVGGGSLDMICTEANQTLSIEQLDEWGTGTDGTGASNIAGLTSVEGPGVYQDPATGTWIATYSDTLCGYCSGTGTGYATASSPLGPYTAPADVGFSAPSGGRRDITATSCGGQPRTISVVGGVAYQGVDLWTGSRNETGAGVLYSPLTYTPTSNTAGDGQVWTPPLSYPC
jgi:hypothetical protein